LFPVKSGTEPDNKARDLIHSKILLKQQNNRYFGGRQASLTENSVITKDTEIKG
jgi:hypothetical protein